MRIPWHRRKIDGHAITCRQVVALVTAYLDGTLPRGEHDLFEAHLSECEDCTEYVRQIRTTVELTGHLKEDDLSSPAREDLLAVYRRWRNDLDA